ncbi:MAG TPA: sigma-54 dependent transcriptional regulator [Bacteroidales bacterium]|nr:sigma-54 dependent transcriptional regulator [Bacteroidales bacterium]HPB88742.1 sigma-54 dependent transcriptional regulator [Bacteroidales bacterium]HPY22407.1 sigma-54 dependent transcriptional regulator [Bacteroidales bacterium]HQN24394.1 sigma-54 dependent transcriptional regulator [Bacteroidales bacterium]
MAKNKAKILVVDDNSGIRAALKLLLPIHFSEVELISSPKELMSKISSFSPDVVLLDMNFHTDINTGNEGLFWLSEIKSKYEEIEVVLFTAYADIALAVEGMKRGAFDFIVKPWDNEKLIETLRKASIVNKKESKPTESEADSSMFWGSGKAMKVIRSRVNKIADTDATILITGENGTGKDVLAREIHRLSDRASQPMVNVDAGALTETLFESELFGHVKGAFTDAHTDHVGKFELADGGTLFLDEIGNIPLHLQAKLLRVIQNRNVVRVGDTKEIPIDIRLICATNKDLEKMVAAEEFREDLYYRINTIHLHLPPLRERIDEIEPLAKLFLGIFAKKYRRNVSEISEEVLELLKSHPWSGNIRELRNCIEKAVILSEGAILTPKEIELKSIQSDSGSREISSEDSLEETEKKAIMAAIDRFGGNLSMVAKSLGISRPTLYAKLKKYNI